MLGNFLWVSRCMRKRLSTQGEQALSRVHETWGLWGGRRIGPRMPTLWDGALKSFLGLPLPLVSKLFFVWFLLTRIDGGSGRLGEEKRTSENATNMLFLRKFNKNFFILNKYFVGGCKHFVLERLIFDTFFFFQFSLLWKRFLEALTPPFSLTLLVIFNKIM